MDVRSSQHRGWVDAQVRYGLKVLLRMKCGLRIGPDCKSGPTLPPDKTERMEECPDQQGGKSDRDQAASKDQTGTVNSFDVETREFDEGQGGGTVNDKVDMVKGKENTSITTHEVNHAMGNEHYEKGGNQSPDGGGVVGASQIGETLQGVGIGGDNAKRNQKSSVGDGTLLNGSSSKGLESGVVMSVKKYNRLLKRIAKENQK